MNIIFGNSIDLLPDQYLKLELDTFKIGSTGQTHTAYCLLQDIPLAEFPMLENNKNNHSALIEQYKKQNWDFCLQMIDQLTGAWNGQVDSFYADLKNRIQSLVINPPAADWDGTIVKSVAGS